MPSKERPILIWFRQDLRLDDNPALIAAAKLDAPIIALYTFNEAEFGQWAPGGASKWWLHHSLLSLKESLKERDIQLVVRDSASPDAITEIVETYSVQAVFWNRCYEPEVIARDKKIKETLENIEGLEVKSFNAALIIEPWEVSTGEGKPYQVYTPFSKKFFIRPKTKSPPQVPRSLKGFGGNISSLEVDELNLLPAIAWDEGFEKVWTPGEESARKNLNSFLKEAVKDYDDNRDLPGLRGTSRLSPHLHFGEISPRRIWDSVEKKFGRDRQKGAHVYLKEVVWREFAYHLMFHFPKTPTEPLRDQFKKFPWKKSKTKLQRWQRGQTGYPIVDAGMRELWHIGWMHNRVRMIVASFLVKHLLIPWQEGADWFWDTLVDADLASNTLGWQWTAGCGADAAPYFRVFNPILQGKRFDKDGSYVRKWVPEIAGLSNSKLHEPWNASADELKEAGIELGKDYPKPIVDHFEARDYALEAYGKIKN